MASISLLTTDYFTLLSLQFCVVGIPAEPGANVPPIAECRGLGLPVYDTCQVMYDIDDGSFDPMDCRSR